MKLLDRVREAIRLRHYSRRTERTYLQWIKRFIRFHVTDDGQWRHPKDMGAEEINAFLSFLAQERRVSSSTQNQALNAIIFLFRHAVGVNPGNIDAVRARRARRLPTVLSRPEVAAVMAHLRGTCRLAVELMYGAGLRVSEVCQLRVKDVDLERLQIIVREAKGNKDRVVMLPRAVRDRMGQQLVWRRARHERDLRAGAGGVELPAAFGRKAPGAARSFSWQYLFPSARTITYRESGQRGRHRCRSCSDTRSSKPRRSTPTSWRKGRPGYEVPSTHWMGHGAEANRDADATATQSVSAPRPMGISKRSRVVV